jgi:signal transduction histidine kinase
MPSLPSRRVAAPRVTLLAALLTLTVILVASLAYEAHDAVRSHRVTAERALRDYASVAAWEYVAKVQERLDAAATQVLSPVTSVRASSPYELLAAPDVMIGTSRDGLACDPARGDSGRVAFRVDLRDGAVAMGSARGDTTFVRWLRDTIVTHTRLRFRPEMRQAALFNPTMLPGRVVFYGIRYAQHGAPLAAYGFSTCPRAIRDNVLRDVMRVHALLPGSVTGGAANDSLLVLTVRDATGREWFRSAADTTESGSTYASEVSLDAAGLPLMVRAVLRPSAPERLLVAGPRANRLPILLGLLALTAALAAVAVLQLRREHDLARMRADFTSSVSHELRTPLAQILLFGETLHLGRVRSDEDRRLAVETIVHEARRLMRMVDNVLHFARTTEGRHHLEPSATELGPLVESIAAAFAPLAAERGASVVVAVREPVTAVVDGGGFRQIVLNLLDNALKFGPPGQTVRVTVSKQGDWARVVVDDEGPGIPVADRGRIWNPYVRLRRPQNAGLEGSGIGLAVVRELAEMHGGAVRVDEPVGRGARFVVELPVAADGEIPLPQRTTSRRDRARDRSGWGVRARRQVTSERESPESGS